MLNEEIKGRGFSEKKLRKEKALSRKYVKEALDNASGAGQAVLKITGYSKSQSLLAAHSAYISRNGKLPVKGRSNNNVGKEELREKQKMWIAEDRSKNKNRRIAVKMILSAPKGSDPNKVERAASSFADNTFGDNHDYFSVLHTDTDNPHVHLVVQMQGFNGKRLNPRKANLSEWRESFANELRQQGIRVISTSRASRGVGKKTDKLAVAKMRERGETPYYEAALHNDLKQKKAEGPGVPPWERKQKETNETFRRRYKLMGQALGQSKDADVQQRGKEIIQFAKELPVPMTRRESILERKQIEGSSLERGIDTVDRDR